MSSEETLIQVRREKHQELNGGTYPLPTDQFVWSIASFLNDIDSMIRENEIKTTIDLAEARGNGTRTLHGRLTALRKSGALTFMKLTDATGSIQIIATRNNFTDYDRFKLLDLGDIVEMTGEPVLSKTGERSLLVAEWKVLTKAHRPPPEKFHGIADEELKYRKRYLDLMGSEESRARFVIRSTIVRAIREYMDGNNFIEVETSTLSSIASGANAKPFETHHNALDIPLRLRIAPELNLKRLLVGGFERVYEIGRNYRNEGIDTRHNPEFTMIESYQAYGTFSQLITFTRLLLQHVEKYLDRNLPRTAAPYWEQWKQDRKFNFWQMTEVGMHEAVMNACGKAEISLSIGGCELFCGGCVSDEVLGFTTNNTSNERLQKIDLGVLSHALSEAHSSGEQWMHLFEYLAEPFLVEDYENRPVFITRYPKSVCPLARANDHRTNECDRFELFVEGRELANAFQELNDPDEQALRFKEQLEAGGKDPMAYDADYVEALQHGMPPAIGFGMGIDRLVMLLTNTSSIKDVILFPTLRPEQ